MVNWAMGTVGQCHWMRSEQTFRIYRRMASVEQISAHDCVYELIRKLGEREGGFSSPLSLYNKNVREQYTHYTSI